MSTDRVTTPLFELGNINATPGAIVVALHAAPELLTRHVTGDWGTVDAEDWGSNDSALIHGLRIVSSYEVGGEKVWIITEADRSNTTLLLPSEY